MRRDDDLVWPKRPDRIGDGHERVAVADFPGCLDLDRGQALESVVEALLRRFAGRILVRGERLEPRVQRGTDDEESRSLGERERADRAQELRATDRLVRDHEDAPLSRVPELLDVLALGCRTSLAKVDGDRSGREPEEHQEPERRRDPRRDHDEGERTDRDQQESESRFLASKRALHGQDPKGGRPSCTRRSTSRRRNASRSRGARRHGGAPASSARGSPGW